jgi:hypothetical protein
LWANAEVYWATAKDMWHTRRWSDKLRVWLKPPGWRPADVAMRFPRPAFDIHRERFDPPLPRALAIYCLLQFALLLGMTTQFLDLSATAGLPVLLGYAAYLVGSLTVLGALMEGRPGARAIEAVRVLATALLPWLTGRWFGIDALDGRLAIGLLAVFAGSALALVALAIPASAVSRSTRA